MQFCLSFIHGKSDAFFETSSYHFTILSVYFILSRNFYQLKKSFCCLISPFFARFLRYHDSGTTILMRFLL